MNDEQIEQLAQRVAKIILDQLHEGLILDMQPDQEEELLAELARCMTLMSKYLSNRVIHLANSASKSSSSSGCISNINPSCRLLIINFATR